MLRIGSLTGLELLDVSDTRSLRTLPESISGLQVRPMQDSGDNVVADMTEVSIRIFLLSV